MGRTILVVDDEPDIRVLARVTLQSAGFDVLEAGTGEDAISMVKAQTPDAMLLDVRLPGMDGWAVLESLRESAALSDLPVVVFSAHEMGQATVKAHQLGSVGFLAKPFMPEELVSAMNSAMSGSPVVEQGGQRIESALEGSLYPGERLEISAEALVRVALQFFHRGAVYLTNRRLLVMKPAWPWGFKLDSSHDRGDLSVVKFKRKMDGSQLVIIKHATGVECLFFARRFQEQAIALVAAIGLAEGAADSA
jgi:DNA-binding response OmpR family regulator